MHYETSYDAGKKAIWKQADKDASIVSRGSSSEG